MKKHFSTVEVLEIAQDMELDGKTFYLEAAARVKDKEIKTLLMDLADWEQKHYELFSEMLKKIIGTAGQEIVDPDDEASLYINAIVSGSVYDKNQDVESLIAECVTEMDYLNSALRLEKDSIAYYLGLKEMVSAQEGKTVIDDIIKEEMSHIRVLSEKLNHLTAT